jgi:hypothetical protein
MDTSEGWMACGGSTVADALPEGVEGFAQCREFGFEALDAFGQVRARSRR